MIATTRPMPRLPDPVEPRAARRETAAQVVSASELAAVSAPELSVAVVTEAVAIPATASDDARVAARIAVRAAIGAVLGGMLGAALGAIVGEAVVLQSGGVTGYSGGVIVGLVSLVAAIVCFAIGAFIGGESALPTSD